jgi:purine-nucleoside phosphorylase
MLLEATSERLACLALRQALPSLGLRAGVHAAVPGPQYETAAELSVLRTLGAVTVSMSGAAEVRAVRDESLDCAIICQVTNAGPTSHHEVIAATARAAAAFTAAVAAVLSAWGLSELFGAGAEGDA